MGKKAKAASSSERRPWGGGAARGRLRRRKTERRELPRTAKLYAQSCRRINSKWNSGKRERRESWLRPAMSFQSERRAVSPSRQRRHRAEWPNYWREADGRRWTYRAT